MPRPSESGRQGFLKTPGDSKERRVAKFLILIGSEQASQILSRLDAEQVEEISKEITTIKSIDAEEGQAVLEEFRSLLSSPFSLQGVVSGGIEAARRLLYTAYGPDKGEALLVRAVPEVKENPLDFLSDFSGDQLALLFKEESPLAAALVFSRLPPKLSAAAIANFTGDKKLQIVRCIAKQTAVPPEVIQQVAGALREKARHISSTDDKEFDGMSALAAILKSSDASFGDQIIGELEADDPALGKDLKDRIYTMDDIIFAQDLPIQKKLAAMENRDIVLLMKGRSGPFREKLLSNLSQGRRSEVLEEEEIMGPVPKKEAAEASAAFLSWFRKSREEGKIVMLSDEDLVL
jgi:flagellar motor switch protein FliG